MVKLITSVAAMRLVEQGKLSLEGPLPEIDPAIADPQVLDGFDAKGDGEMTFSGTWLADEMNHFMPVDEVECGKGGDAIAVE